MSNVSKLVIKACSDNKFSSFSGEFITSINPENLTIKSAVSYHVPQGIANATLLKYRGSPPKLLSFSLLFDTTGMIPGSNAIPVMEQVKQLQDVAYNVHKKNNAPNYIRIIWGQIDFKGRLVDLDIVYSMFQVDGTLVRAEAHLSVLEELVSLGKGKSAAGVDGNYPKPSGASATSKQRAPLGQGSAGQDGFAATPNGMNGPYSGAPPGAYDGGPDQVYQGSNGSGGAVYASPAAGKDHAGNPTATAKPSGSSRSDADVSSGSGTGYANTDLDHSDNGLKGGVAGNGPGGSGGGVGGGGHGPGGDGAKSGGGIAPTNSQREAGSSPARAPKSQGAPVPAGGKASAAGGLSKTAAGAALGAASATGGLAAAASGLNSLRGKVDGLTAKGKLLKLLQRVKNFAKKTAPRAYDAGKKAVKKI